MCAPLDLGCIGGELISSAAGNALADMAEAVIEGMGKAFASLGTLWVNVGTPVLATDRSGTPSAVVDFIQSSLGFYTLALAILAIMIGGGRMAWERRAQPAKDTLRAVITLVVASSAGLLVIALLVRAADAFSVWIIDRSITEGDFATNLGLMVSLSSATPIGVILVIILGICATVVAAIQVMLMVIRGGMLVVLAGILPLSASFTNTEMGKSWFTKVVGWTLAFILYKPAAAIIYATAFQLVGGNNILLGSTPDQLAGILTGLVLMVMALVALPALMRFVAPMTAAVASGGGGGGGGALAGAAASGAITVGRSGSNSAGSVASSSGATAGAKGAATVPAASGAASAGAGAGAAAGAGGAAAGVGAGAAAGTAGGPIGMGAGAAAGAVGSAAVSGAQAVGRGVTSTVNSQVDGEGGPSGSS